MLTCVREALKNSVAIGAHQLSGIGIILAGGRGFAAGNGIRQTLYQIRRWGTIVSGARRRDAPCQTARACSITGRRKEYHLAQAIAKGGTRL
ncbi:hypothetical protein KCP70_19925 [Salmonella enterica subsp. enterica]|nr:hypothetical protein KCP70_19925 [Salmonella enterica subsp. enterica]